LRNGKNFNADAMVCGMESLEKSRAAVSCNPVIANCSPDRGESGMVNSDSFHFISFEPLLTERPAGHLEVNLLE